MKLFKKKIKSIQLETMDNNFIEFKLKHLKNIHINNITVSISHKEWMSSGKIKPHNYDLRPESLSKLIEVIKESKYNKKLSFHLSENFLKRCPTKEIYLREIEEYDKLPILEVDGYYTK